MPLEIITWNIPGNTSCKKLCITYSFIVDNPTILGNFMLLLGQDQLAQSGRELPNIFPYLGVPEYFR